MTGVDVVPQSRTQVQCASPVLSTEQLRVPAAFSLPPPGFIPKEDTHTRPEWLSTLILLFHSLRGFFSFPLVFARARFSFCFFAAKPRLHLPQRPASGQPAIDPSFLNTPKVVMFSQKHAHSSAVSPSDDVSGGLVQGFG